MVLLRLEIRDMPLVISINPLNMLGIKFGSRLSKIVMGAKALAKYIKTLTLSSNFIIREKKIIKPAKFMIVFIEERMAFVNIFMKLSSEVLGIALERYVF